VEKKKRGQTRTWAELLEASDIPSTQVTFEVPGGKRARTDGDGEDEGPTTVSSTRPEGARGHNFFFFCFRFQLGDHKGTTCVG
jgi:hypothetical protein